MRRHLIAVAVLALALPLSASAKGPVAATVSGPGLERPLTLQGGGSVGPLWRVVEHSGFFQAAFGGYATKPSSERPGGELGPRYVVECEMGSRQDVIRQDLYPYANPAPVSYTAPGQRFYGTRQTPGGWLVADPELKAVLVEAGLPREAPSAGSDGRTLDDSWLIVVAVAIAVGLGCALALAVFRRRTPAVARS